MAKDNKKFWNLYANLYDFEINRFSRAAYTEMYRLMSRTLTKEMNVLEIATGTGLIAINIAAYAGSVEAVDFSPKMIAAANKKSVPDNVRFSVMDATSLDFADRTFDAVIISNALHIIPEPDVVLANIRRVLKSDGVLIAPNFTHGHLSKSSWNLNTAILKFIGFETYAKWLPDEYVEYINKHGFTIGYRQLLNAAFPLVYLEARLRNEETVH
jgi:Methylase involved in ubiquinone/menaquinone biosynthesis